MGARASTVPETPHTAAVIALLRSRAVVMAVGQAVGLAVGLSVVLAVVLAVGQAVGLAVGLSLEPSSKRQA